jgi:hypothetical protein
MNAHILSFTAISLLVAAWAGAQNSTPEPPQDPVQAAIRQFNENRAAAKQNEVTVVLDPVGTPPAPVADNLNPPPAGARPNSEAVPDTGPPPTLPDAPAPPHQGLTVHVEKLQVGSGTIEPSQVKLLAPFPAKPLTPAPAGWSLQSSPTAPPFTREVELSPGNRITLTVRPHILVPDADGAAAFNVPEPGFDASLGYHQNTTVGAILSHSIRQLDDDSKELGATIDKLQQLLVSLPKPPPLAEPVPEPQTMMPAPALKPALPRKR